MAEKRDYYEVLGVAKTASADEIKKAYRSAAMKWHPDRWVDGTDAEKKTAEEKFKEASEAYSVLSDPDKKAKYDQFGFAGVGDNAGGQNWAQDFGSLDDLLKNIFGGGFSFGGSSFGGGSPFGGRSQRNGGSRVVRGSDLAVKVRLTLEEIASGCEKTVTVERNRPCPSCGGKGTTNASDIKVCPTCNGSGQVMTGSFIFSKVSTCPNCKGSGKIVSNPCSQCRGTGVVKVRENVTVKIPAGVEGGMQLTVQGGGDTGPMGGVNGDLYVTIEEIPHSFFKREGQNLFYTKVIRVTDAILGCEISIPCLDGPQTLKLPAGTQSGTVQKLRGKGLPSVNGYGKGDLYVKILIWVPHKLSKSEKDAFEAMRGSDSFKPAPTRDDMMIFKKESEFF